MGGGGGAAALGQCGRRARPAASPSAARVATPSRNLPRPPADRAPSFANLSADLHRGRAVLCRLEQEIAKLAPSPGELVVWCHFGVIVLDLLHCAVPPGAGDRHAGTGAQLAMPWVGCAEASAIGLKFSRPAAAPSYLAKPPRPPALPHCSPAAPYKTADNGLTKPGAFLFELLARCGITPATWHIL